MVTSASSVLSVSRSLPVLLKLTVSVFVPATVMAMMRSVSVASMLKMVSSSTVMSSWPSVMFVLICALVKVPPPVVHVPACTIGAVENSVTVTKAIQTVLRN